MPDALAWILGVAIFLVVIALSIALHEAGHMVVAKKLGIPVPRFFVGFGPTLWAKKIGLTEYGIKAIPLGGFIAVEDQSQPEDSPERVLLSYVAPWKRILIFLAGPAVNIVLGVAIFFALLMATPLMVGSTTVTKVNSSCAKNVACGAQEAGILPGDTIVSVGGQKIAAFEDLGKTLKPGLTQVEVLRQGATIPLQVQVDSNSRLGITVGTTERQRTAGEAVEVINELFYRSFKTMAALPSHVPRVAAAIAGTEERNPEGVSSVVGVGRTYGDTVATDKLTTDSKVRALISYTALLNVGLGIANLLPMLPLDGGRIFVALMDSFKGLLARIRRRPYTPLAYKWVSSMTIVTGSLVASYMVLLIVADIVAPMSFL